MPKTSEVLTPAEIDAFARRLKATVAAAEQGAALLALVSGFDLRAGTGKKAGAAAKAASGKAAPAPKKKSSKRKPALDTAKVLVVLKGAPKDGLAVSEIAKKLEVKEIHRVQIALRKLRDAKQSKVTGDKAKARWHTA